jgi:hypothetical protein
MIIEDDSAWGGRMPIREALGREQANSAAHDWWMNHPITRFVSRATGLALMSNSSFA